MAPAQPAQPAMAIARGCSGDPRKPRVFGLFLAYLADAKCKATGFQDFHVTIAYNCTAGMHLIHLMGFDSNRKSDAGTTIDQNMLQNLLPAVVPLQADATGATRRRRSDSHMFSLTLESRDCEAL